MRQSLCPARRYSRLVVVVAAALVLLGCGTQSAMGGSGGRPRSCRGDAGTRCDLGPFSESVLDRVSESISPVGCRPFAQHESTRATAFAVGEHQAVTAYHVVRARCFIHGEITSFGGRSAVVAAKSSAHGLALLNVIGYRARSVLRPATAHTGERLALLGYPHDRVNAPLRVTYGTILSMDRVVTLSGPVGTETLTDAILVSVPAAHGESGGPAIDAAGRVVGVFQGGDSSIRLLTPAVDLCIGHTRALRCT